MLYRKMEALIEAHLTSDSQKILLIDGARQVGKTYLVCIGNVKVKIRFANNGVSFEDAFEELLLSV